jgi:hypothetical protein
MTNTMKHKCTVHVNKLTTYGNKQPMINQTFWKMKHLPLECLGPIINCFKKLMIKEMHRIAGHQLFHYESDIVNVFWCHSIGEKRTDYFVIKVISIATKLSRKVKYHSTYIIVYIPILIPLLHSSYICKTPPVPLFAYITTSHSPAVHSRKYRSILTT